jgi:hypothetical protein
LLISYVTLNNLINTCSPHFPYLLNRKTSITNLVEFCND